MTPKLCRINWTPAWRLVSSRFPPVGLFDRVAHTEELKIVFAIESITNDRLREETGDISLVPEEDRITGEGTTPIMAAFTHINPEGSRFTDGSYGVYYAARSIDVAIAETCFHRIRFLTATNEPPIELVMRSYASNIDANLHDIRGKQDEWGDIYDPDPGHYMAPQAFAKELRSKDSNGIAYSSVRDPGGECIAVFRPCILQPVTQGPHYCYVWDGATIITIYIKTEYRR